jgi:hypothetical protein
VISPLELSANGIATLSILLAGRNSVHTWWTGIVGCLLFGALFLQSRLYADVLLQGFFLVTCARSSRRLPLLAIRKNQDLSKICEHPDKDWESMF